MEYIEIDGKQVPIDGFVEIDGNKVPRVKVEIERIYKNDGSIDVIAKIPTLRMPLSKLKLNGVI